MAVPDRESNFPELTSWQVSRYLRPTTMNMLHSSSSLSSIVSASQTHQKIVHSQVSDWACVIMMTLLPCSFSCRNVRGTGSWFSTGFPAIAISLVLGSNRWSCSVQFRDPTWNGNWFSNKI